MIRQYFFLSFVFATFCVTHARIPLAIRGDGTVHLRPDGKTFTVDVEKRDLNIYDGADTLKVTVIAPDRSIVDTLDIGDDGMDGKGGASAEVQTGTLSVPVTMDGIYQVTFNQSNGDQVYGFQTSCKRYVIESPLFLNDSSLSGDIYFQPPSGEFTIQAEPIHEPGIQSLPLQDGSGRLLHTFELQKLMEPAAFTVGESVPRDEIPWHISVARQDIRIKIKGVSVWSDRPDSFFDLSLTKSLLTPYVVGVDLMPGASRRVRLDLYNSKDQAARINFHLSPDGPVSARVVTPDLPVLVESRLATPVDIEVSLASDAAVGSEHRIMVSAYREGIPEATSAATIRVRVGPPRADAFLSLPIVLRSYEHESVQFGYCPEYEPNAVFFDLENRPYIRWRRGNKDRTTGIQTLVEGRWVEQDFIVAVRKRYPDFVMTRRSTGWHGTKTSFDSANHLYTLLEIGLSDKTSRNILLDSDDGGKTFGITELPLEKGVADIEHWTGHNTIPGPPSVVLYEYTKPHPARFASFYDMKILFPVRKGSDIDLGEPVLVTDKCFGTCLHSGAPAPVVTIGDRTHIVWGEIDDSGVSGVPTYAATYFHKEHRLSEKVLMGYAPPVNDVHNQPGICADSKGYLHVVTGAHGQPFLYRRSLKPNDVLSGWTEAVPVCTTDNIDPKTGKEGGRQTYLSLLCDANDTLHIAYRQWRRGVDPYHDGAQYAALAYQRKPAGKPWQKPVPIVVPPLPSYSVYYHKLTHDRLGRLFLSYSYYSINEAYRNDIPELYDYRAVVMSPDGGDHWKLLTTQDLQ